MRRARFERIRGCAGSATSMLACALASGLLLGCAAPPAAAPDAAPLSVQALAATCAACHGTDGAAVPGAAMPELQGRERAVLAASLRAYKAGRLAGTVMPQIAKGYRDDQIDALASYFADAEATARGRAR